MCILIQQEFFNVADFAFFDLLVCRFNERAVLIVEYQHIFRVIEQLDPLLHIRVSIVLNALVVPMIAISPHESSSQEESSVLSSREEFEQFDCMLVLAVVPKPTSEGNVGYNVRQKSKFDASLTLHPVGLQCFPHQLEVIVGKGVDFFPLFPELDVSLVVGLLDLLKVRPLDM